MLITKQIFTTSSREKTNDSTQNVPWNIKDIVLMSPMNQLHTRLLDRSELQIPCLLIITRKLGVALVNISNGVIFTRNNNKFIKTAISK